MQAAFLFFIEKNIFDAWPRQLDFANFKFINLIVSLQIFASFQLKIFLWSIVKYMHQV